ncbi:MAG: NADH-dependent [FeFe] hydrogenase, group A6 [Candidatus Muiribacteriota bacterium]
MANNNFVKIDGLDIQIENEKNLLELIRKANINLPTFCYHSDLSIYGACRLCMVEIEGRGLQASCSIIPEPGMNIKTNTEEIRKIRKNIVELLLANHDYNCTSCSKSMNCQLQALAKRVGIKEPRFKSTLKKTEKDYSSISLVRDPNRCVLCGDCVRMCREIQSVGAIDFAFRGSEVAVLPAFGKDIADGECVNCGQCVAVCPTGALTIRSEVEEAWKAVHDKSKTVVVQIAPAVRVALGEKFGMAPGTSVTGQIVGALRLLGFDKIFDTSYTADLTIIEEVNEFLERKEKNKLPLFTSCCPSWVKFAEQFYPEMLENISSCRSPQQMFGSLLKNKLPEMLNISPENLVVVSVMPCTAKKFEAKRPEFTKNGIADVDIVLSTQELASMIEEQGIDFNKIQPDSLDMPFGFKTGAGVIFGNSGGVTEAVLRYAEEKLTGTKKDEYVFESVRGSEGLKKAEITLNGLTLKFAIVNGLANARTVIEHIKSGKEHYDFIEVMACPGGCIGGAGQPVGNREVTKKMRTQSIYNTDKTLQLHKSQQNPYIKELYTNDLEKAGSKKAHEMLHTHYNPRKRTLDDGISLTGTSEENSIDVSVCVGTSCYTRGSQDLIMQLAHYVEANNLSDRINVKASFCFENCGKSPNVKVGETLIEKATFAKVTEAINEAVNGEAVSK